MDLDNFDIGVIAAFIITSISSLVNEYSDYWLITAIKFIAPIIGLILTYFRLKKFKTFQWEFKKSDWKNNGNNELVIEIPESTHKKGINPTIDVFQKTNGEFQKIMVDESMCEKGNVKIGASSAFDGKATIA